MNHLAFDGATGENTAFFLAHAFGTITYVWIGKTFPSVRDNTPTWAGVLITDIFLFLTTPLCTLLHKRRPRMRRELTVCCDSLHAFPEGGSVRRPESGRHLRSRAGLHLDLGSLKNEEARLEPARVEDQHIDDRLIELSRNTGQMEEAGTMREETATTPKFRNAGRTCTNLGCSHPVYIRARPIL